MVAVDQPQERALGDGRRQVLQLTQPIEPQLADAVEVVLAQARPRQQIREAAPTPRSANRASVVSVNIVASGPTSTS